MSADLGIRIFLDDAASAGLGAFGDHLLGLGSIVGGLGHNFGTLSPMMQGVGLVAAGSGIAFGLFAGAIKYSVDQAMQIQDALTGVELKVNGARDRTEEMTQTLIRLSDTSKFSIQDVADGFAELGAQGQNAANILANNGALGTAMIDLAESMGQDGTAGAAKLLGEALKIFHIDASDASGVADTLDVAFHNGIPNINQLTAALAQAGPAAAYLHIPLNELSAYLDVMSQDMGSGSKAATSMSNILLAFTNPTNKAAKALGDLGIAVVNQTNPALLNLQAQLRASGAAGVTAADNFQPTVKGLIDIFGAAQKAGIKGLGSDFYEWGLKTGVLSDKMFDAKGNFIGLGNALQLVSDKLKGLPTDQAARLMQDLTNKTATKGLEDMMTNFGLTKQQADGLMDAMSKAGQAARDAALVMQQLSNIVKEVHTNFQHFAGLIGLQMIPMLSQIGGGIASLIGNFNTLSPSTYQVIAQFLLIGAAISGAVFIISTLVFVFGTLGVITPIVGGIVMALVGLSAGITWVMNNWKLIQSAFETARPVLAALAGIIGAVAAAFIAVNFGAILWGIAGIVAGALTLASTVVPALLAVLAPLAGAFIAAFWPALLIGAAIGIVIFGVIAAFRNWGEATKAIGAFFAPVIGAIQAAWKALLPSLQAVFVTLSQLWTTQLKPAFLQMWQTLVELGPVFKILGAIVGGVLVVAFGLLIGILAGLIHAFAVLIGAVVMIFSGLVLIVSGSIHILISIISFIPALIYGIFTGNFGPLKAAWASFWIGLGELVRGIGIAIAGVVVSVIGPIIAFFYSFITTIIAFFTHLYDVLVGHSIVPDLVKAILKWIQGMGPQALAFISGLVTGAITWFLTMATSTIAHIVTFVTNILSYVNSLRIMGIAYVTALVMGFLLQIGNLENRGIAYLISFVSGALSWINNLAGGLLSRVTGMSGSFTSQIGSMVTNAIGFISGLPGRAAGALAGLGQLLFNSGANAMQMFANGLSSALGAVVSKVQEAAGKVADFLAHHSPAKMGPLSDDDKWMPRMMQMHADGILNGIPTLQNASNAAALAMNRGFYSPQTARIGGASQANVGGNITLPITLDGNKIAEVVVNRVTGTLAMNGMNRAWR